MQVPAFPFQSLDRWTCKPDKIGRSPPLQKDRINECLRFSLSWQMKCSFVSERTRNACTIKWDPHCFHISKKFKSISQNLCYRLDLFSLSLSHMGTECRGREKEEKSRIREQFYCVQCVVILFIHILLRKKILLLQQHQQHNGAEQGCWSGWESFSTFFITFSYIVKRMRESHSYRRTAAQQQLFSSFFLARNSSLSTHFPLLERKLRISEKTSSTACMYTSKSYLNSIAFHTENR